MAKIVQDALEAAAIRAGAELALFATSKQGAPVQPAELARRAAEMAALILGFYVQMRDNPTKTP
jgi:hypothetical protein